MSALVIKRSRTSLRASACCSFGRLLKPRMLLSERSTVVSVMIVPLTVTAGGDLLEVRVGGVCASETSAQPKTLAAKRARRIARMTSPPPNTLDIRQLVYPHDGAAPR